MPSTRRASVQLPESCASVQVPERRSVQVPASSAVLVYSGAHRFDEPGLSTLADLNRKPRVTTTRWEFEGFGGSNVWN